jgi:hypothetical protein
MVLAFGMAIRVGHTANDGNKGICLRMDIVYAVPSKMVGLPTL